MQESYEERPSPAVAGMRAYTIHDTTIRSVLLEEPVAFGKFVCKGDAEAQSWSAINGRLPMTGPDVTSGGLGFVQRDAGREPDAASGGFPADVIAPVVARGGIHVPCEDAWSFGGAVYVRVITGLTGALADTDLGNVRSDDDSGDAFLLPGARFENTGATGGLALVVCSITNVGPTGPTAAVGATGPTGAVGATGPAGG